MDHQVCVDPLDLSAKKYKQYTKISFVLPAATYVIEIRNSNGHM